MRKLILVIILAMIVIAAAAIYFYFIYKNDGDGGEENNGGDGDTFELTEGLVEYDKSMGEVCPLKTKFLGQKSAPLIECQCPEGYEMQSDIIGYEQCYGEGSECPILSSECLK